MTRPTPGWSWGKVKFVLAGLGGLLASVVFLPLLLVWARVIRPFLRWVAVDIFGREWRE